MGREEDSGSGDPEVPVCILGLINCQSSCKMNKFTEQVLHADTMLGLEVLKVSEI